MRAIMTERESGHAAGAAYRRAAAVSVDRVGPRRPAGSTARDSFDSSGIEASVRSTTRGEKVASVFQKCDDYRSIIQREGFARLVEMLEEKIEELSSE